MKNILSLILFFFVFSQVNAQTFFSEDFENGMPDDWEVNGIWEVSDSASTSLYPTWFGPSGPGLFMVFYDMKLMNEGGNNGRAISPVISLPEFTEPIFLNFESSFTNHDAEGDETAKVYISADDGVSWTELLNNEVEGLAWMPISIPIETSYSNKDIRVAFEYDDGGGWNCGWAVDNIELGVSFNRDLSFDHNNREAFLTGAFVDALIYPGGVITNNGLENVQSVDLIVTVNGSSTTHPINNLNLARNERALIKIPDPIYMAEDILEISVSITNVNGLGDDENPMNDQGEPYTITPITPHPDKAVFVEEWTGTWCINCPRGTVMMDAMNQRYPNGFVGVAVHNSDPMEVFQYNQGFIDFGGFGLPSMIVDRTEIVLPNDLEQRFLDAVTEAPAATLNVGAAYSEETRFLDVSVDALFQEAIPEGYKFNVVILEDHVTGSGFMWEQINEFSGGVNMDIFSIYPNPVPSDLIEYNHVARRLFAGFEGTTDGLEDSFDIGETAVITFPTYAVPDDYNTENLYIAAVLYNNLDVVDNAVLLHLDEAIANGLYSSIDENVIPKNNILLTPNPFTNSLEVSIREKNNDDCTLDVYNMIGELVFKQSYKGGTDYINFDGSQLEEGTYIFKFNIDAQIQTYRRTKVNR